MAQKDLGGKVLLGINDVFADVANVILFQGKEGIKGSELKSAGTHSQYHSDGKYHEQVRDVAKFWKSKGVCLAMLGLESEAAPNRFMPLRVLSYDGGAYRDQLSKAGARGGKKRERRGRIKRRKRIYPVVTMHEPYVHKRSRRALLSEKRQNDLVMRDSLSLERYIPADCPPVFLVNCTDDPVVEYHNSILLDSALTAHKIDHRYYRYHTGGHGFGACIPRLRHPAAASRWASRRSSRGTGSHGRTADCRKSRGSRRAGSGAATRRCSGADS